ncbi:MAG: hypothetical protein AAFQ66_14300 [Pseudomonadota bacterium]
MSLVAMLDIHDEAALSALASVGLVRRASRDLGAGKAEIVERDAVSAKVTADGHTVTLTADGPSAAECTCPATGVCRHIVLAVLALRAEAPDEGEQAGEAPQAPVPTAREELEALDETALKKFAGADWDKAINQAAISAEATVTEDGPNLSVRLPDTEALVMFLAGQGLKGAVFKGPKTTKRRVVAAAALVVRMQAGTQSLDALSRDEPDTETLAADFLVSVRAAIEGAVFGVFGGDTLLAEERLFDLAISARAQAAPRLTGLLRLLAKITRQGRDNHFSYSDDRFLANAALAYALAQALEASPQDPQLTGVLRRTYHEQDSLRLLLLGAVRWRSETGARGTRIHAYATDTKCWYSTGQARGAGADPTFQPESTYHAPLWASGGTVNKMIGSALDLRQPRLSSDGLIAWEHGRARPDPQINMVEEMEEAGLLHRNWGSLLADLSHRTALGLRHNGAPVPVLLQPKDVGDPVFDDISQLYRLPIFDGVGGRIDLAIPGDRHGDVTWLHTNAPGVAAILCEANLAANDLRLYPVTVYLQIGGALETSDLTFQTKTLPDIGMARKLGGRALGFFRTGQKAQVKISAISILCGEVFDAVATTLRVRTTDHALALASRADAVGLGILARALTEFGQDPQPTLALRACYLATEIRNRCLLT